MKYKTAVVNLVEVFEGFQYLCVEYLYMKKSIIIILTDEYI